MTPTPETGQLQMFELPNTVDKFMPVEIERESLGVVRLGTLGEMMGDPEKAKDFFARNISVRGIQRAQPRRFR